MQINIFLRFAKKIVFYEENIGNLIRDDDSFFV